MINRWNKEQIKQIYDAINIDFNDENLKVALREWHFNSIPGTIRDIAFNWEEVAKNIIDNSNRTEEEKKVDKTGISTLFSSIHGDNFSNPDYMDLGEYLGIQEIASLYDSAFALMLSTSVLKTDKTEKLMEDLKDSYNASEFLKQTSLKIAEEIGCQTLAHELLYEGKADGKRPFFPIVGLSDNEDYPSKKNSKGKIYFDAEKRLEEYYRKFERLFPDISPEAIKTIWSYAVLNEVEQIENSDVFCKYRFSNVYKSEKTWGETLENFKNFVQKEYLPKNCFLMSETLYAMKTEINEYSKNIHQVYYDKDISVNINRNLSKDIGKNALCHIHHIFPVAQFPELADQQVNYSALVPDDHLAIAHPENNTKQYNKEFQQFLLFKKFEECSSREIKNCRLIRKDGERMGLLNMLDKVYQTDEFSVSYMKNPDITKFEFADLLRKYDKDFVRPFENEYIRKTVFVDWFKEHNINDDPQFSKNTYKEILSTFASRWKENLTTDFISKSVGFTDNKFDKQLAVNDLINELRDNSGSPTEFELIDILKNNMKKDYASYKEQGLSNKDINERIIESCELLVGVDHGLNRYLAVPVHEGLKAITRQEEKNKFYEFHVESMKHDYDAKLVECGSKWTLDKVLKLYEIDAELLSNSEKQTRENYLDECSKLAKACDYGKTPYQVIDDNFERFYSKFIEKYEEKERENISIEPEDVKILDGDCR